MHTSSILYYYFSLLWVHCCFHYSFDGNLWNNWKNIVVWARNRFDWNQGEFTISEILFYRWASFLGWRVWLSSSHYRQCKSNECAPFLGFAILSDSLFKSFNEHGIEFLKFRPEANTYLVALVHRLVSHDLESVCSYSPMLVLHFALNYYYYSYYYLCYC